MTGSLVASGALALPLKRDHRRAVSRRWVWGGAVAGLGAYILTGMAALFVARLPRGQLWLSRVLSCTVSARRPVAAALVVPAAIGEELFWRERVLARGGRQGDWLRLGPNVAAYALVQAASGNPLPVAGGVLLGLLTGRLRQLSGSILPPIVAHLVYSELTLVAPGLPGSGQLIARDRTDM